MFVDLRLGAAEVCEDGLENIIMLRVEFFVAA
jgi:hypothetical protein